MRSLDKVLSSLTGNISVATVHVRLPIPTLNAAVNSICRRVGVFDCDLFDAYVYFDFNFQFRHTRKY